MRNSIFTLVVSFLFFSCNVITGNGVIKEESRQVPDFNELQTSGSVDVEIQPGTEIGVKVISDENIIPYVVTEVKSGVLEIHFKKGVSISNDHTRVIVSAPSLNKMTTSGSGDISSNGTITNNQIIYLKSSGSGDFKLALDAPAVNITGSGSADFELSGFTKDVSATLSGSGELKCRDLKAENVNVRITGSADAKVFASATLRVAITGSGNVQYWGNPSLPEIKSSGSGTVKSGEQNAQ